MNALLKDLLDWTEVPVDAIMLSFYGLQIIFFIRYAVDLEGLENICLKLFIHPSI